MPKTLTIRVAGDRVTVRRKLLRQFGLEEPGTGKGPDTSRYIYIVETTQSGHRVELHRPANLNKGIDFTVRVPGIKFNHSGNSFWWHIPRHDDIAEALKLTKKQHGQAHYNKIKSCINLIYQSKDFNYPNIFVRIHSQDIYIDVILLSLKWLFIEQDLTYWNHSGRAMLFQKLKDSGLV